MARFESLLQQYLGNPCLTSTSDASSSVMMSLYMAGVRPGDEVVCSPMTCLATNAPVRNLFAEVCWCDIDPATGNMDPNDLARRITGKTKAVLVSHWGGNPVDLDSVYAVARERGIVVVEDASEALGAEYKGRKVGNTGSDYTVFSFYPNKQINTLEGGAISFARRGEFDRGKFLKRYGIHQPTFRTSDGEINPKSDIPEAGFNMAMNNVSACLGVMQMPYLPGIVARHRENGSFFDTCFAGVDGVTVLRRPIGAQSAYWVYSLLVSAPERFMARLRQQGIQCSRVHLRNDLYSCFGPPADLPGVERFAKHCVSIPCGWWISATDREVIAEGVRYAARG